MTVAPSPPISIAVPERPARQLAPASVPTRPLTGSVAIVPVPSSKPTCINAPVGS